MASPISLDVRNIINSIFLNEDTVNVVIWDAPQMAFTPLNPHTSGSLKPPSPMETQLRKTPRYGLCISLNISNTFYGSPITKSLPTKSFCLYRHYF